MASKSETVKEGSDHLSVVPLTEVNMESDKPVPVVKIPPMRLIDGHSKQGKQGTFRYFGIQINQ